MYVFDYCVVDGGWSSWVTGPCTKTCGGGTHAITRRCSNPTPSCGGSNCTGPSFRESVCKNSCCRGKIIKTLCIHIRICTRSKNKF